MVRELVFIRSCVGDILTRPHLRGWEHSQAFDNSRILLKNNLSKGNSHVLIAITPKV